MIFRRLCPDPADVELDDLLAGLDLGALAPGDRPHVAVNFVASLDGRVSVHGRSGALGDDGDHAVFHGLRTLVDAVLVGTGTLRAERYGRIAARPERREQRTGRGLAADPLAVTVTRTGDLPADIPLLADASSTLVVYTGARLETPDAAARIEVTALDPLSFRAALANLRRAHGVRSVLCEGGPTVTGALLAEGVLDELFITVAPRLVGGGTEPTLTAGPPLPGLTEAELIWALERRSFVFLRYRVG